MCYILIYIFYNIAKNQILRSSSGATPQTLYHVSVASTSRSTTWLPDSYSIVCKLYLKTKDALCKLDEVLVSIQSYIKTHILYRFHNKKQYECREVTKDIESYEQQVIVNVAKRHSIAM